MFDNETGEYLRLEEIEMGMWFFCPTRRMLYIVPRYDESRGDLIMENEGPDDNVMDYINQLCREYPDLVASADATEFGDLIRERFLLIEVPWNLRRFDEHDGYYSA